MTILIQLLMAWLSQLGIQPSGHGLPGNPSQNRQRLPMLVYSR